MARRHTVDSLREKARIATREALKGYVIPRDIKDNLALGVLMIDDQYYIYTLYVPAERPKDTLIISRAFANRVTGEIDKVEITNLERKVEEKE